MRGFCLFAFTLTPPSPVEGEGDENQSDLTMPSVIFLASPNSIIVLSR
jgi:hypothetical protein